MKDWKLWLRHPWRMFDLSQGFCPICTSAPPEPMCPVCKGTYAYGRHSNSQTREVWLGLFHAWAEGKK